jgi:hypothetical protein
MTELEFSKDDFAFARREYFELLATYNDADLFRLCQTQSRGIACTITDGAKLVSEEIRTNLQNPMPWLLVRFGDGESNVVMLSELPEEPAALKVFNRIFDMMNGITLADSEARFFSRQFSDAILNADFVGFRSLDRNFMMTETDIMAEADILGTTFQRDDIRALLGILYARKFLEKNARAGYLRKSRLTTAWVHLGLTTHLEGKLHQLSLSPAWKFLRTNFADDWGRACDLLQFRLRAVGLITQVRPIIDCTFRKF